MSKTKLNNTIQLLKTLDVLFNPNTNYKELENIIKGYDSVLKMSLISSIIDGYHGEFINPEITYGAKITVIETEHSRCTWLIEKLFCDIHIPFKVLLIQHFARIIKQKIFIRYTNHALDNLTTKDAGYFEILKHMVDRTSSELLFGVGSFLDHSNLSDRIKEKFVEGNDKEFTKAFINVLATDERLSVFKDLDTLIGGVSDKSVISISNELFGWLNNDKIISDLFFIIDITNCSVIFKSIYTGEMVTRDNNSALHNDDNFIIHRECVLYIGSVLHQ